MANRVAIIGGGASGLICAAALAEASCQDLEVSIYEASDRVGRSILATGNGRCNISNRHISELPYRHVDYVQALMATFELQAAAYGYTEEVLTGVAPINPPGVTAYFASHGLMLREESEGRLYPLANKASAVVDVLRAISAGRAHEVTNTRIVEIIPPKDDAKPFALVDSQGVRYHADYVVIACGGRPDQGLVADLRWLQPHPSLGPLAVRGQLPKHLDNIRVKGTLTLWREDRELAREEGEIMFRKYGVSGIAAFNLSRFAQPGDELHVDFLTAFPYEEACTYAQQRLDRLERTYDREITCADYLRGLVLAPVARELLGVAEYKEGDRCTAEVAQEIMNTLKDLTLTVVGIGDPQQCQVSRGGYAVNGFESTTGEALEIPGLFAVGEALDVDAPCGGFNLHWAWSSGLLVGWTIAQRLNS